MMMILVTLTTIKIKHIQHFMQGGASPNYRLAYKPHQKKTTDTSPLNHSYWSFWTTSAILGGTTGTTSWPKSRGRSARLCMPWKSWRSPSKPKMRWIPRCHGWAKKNQPCLPKKRTGGPLLGSDVLFEESDSFSSRCLCEVGFVWKMSQNQLVQS